MNLLRAAAIFCLCAAAYFFSPARVVMDSHYSMLLSENLWRHGSFALDGHFARPDRHFPGAPLGTNLSYHVYRHNGRVYYNYPPGSSVLSVPLVLAANAAGVSAAHPRNGYDPVGELRIEHGGAALVAALAVALLFLAASRFLDPRRAAAVALAAAFGTGLWSTASRVLWTHTWGVCLLAAAILVLVGGARGPAQGRFGAGRAVLLATLLAWLYFTRPTFSLSIIAIAIYLFARHRNAFAPFAVTGAAWLLAFIAFSYATSGQALPPYFTQGGVLMLRTFFGGLVGVLASPSRGLFIYSPVTLVAIWLALRPHAPSPLLLLAAGASLLHVLALAAWPMWWGGFGYGARLPTDLVPWLVLLAATGWSEAPKRIAPESAVRKVVAAGLLAASVGLQAVGACSMAAWRWNVEPDNITQDTARLWDWRDAQFLRAFGSRGAQ